MKGNYKSIVELATELDRQDKLKNDYTPMSNQISMSDDGERLGLENVGSFEINPLVHTQLANRLKIPKPYYDKIKEVPGLLAENVNTLLVHTPERRTVRTLDGKARAFLSDRYKAIDHLFIMTPFMEALMDYKKKTGSPFEVQANVLSDARMYIQVTFPNISGEVKVGDVVKAGVMFTNSEVGLGAFDVKSLYWRLACANGMTSESFIRKYHTGRKIGADEEDYNIYSDATLKKEMDAFRSRLGDIFRHAITEEAFTKVLNKLKHAVGNKISRPNTVIENVTKRFNLTADDGDSILGNMMEEGNINRYGLSNAITALAKEVDNAEKAYDYEKLGGEIITLSSSEWNVISEGAVA